MADPCKLLVSPGDGIGSDIAGHGIANPIGTIPSVGLMFEYSLHRPDLAQRIEDAVEACLDAGVSSADLGGDSDTDEVCTTILSSL